MSGQVRALGAIAVALLAVVALLGLLVRAERMWRRLANRLVGDGQEQLGALDRLDQVWEQVHPDHGGSLRDQVDATHELVRQHIATPRDQAHPRR